MVKLNIIITQLLFRVTWSFRKYVDLVLNKHFLLLVLYCWESSLYFWSFIFLFFASLKS